MEFNEKLQELRKKKGLTQDELAQALYVSRAAISKWESGRGYPNIDSLKAIAKLFSVTIDDLLSGEQVLAIAEEDHKQRGDRICSLVFGLLDCSLATFLFLPLFGQQVNEAIQEVSLLSLTEIQAYLRITYFVAVVGMVITGILTLALQKCENTVWTRAMRKISILLNAAGALLFTISLQPYPAVFLFVFLAIKVLLLVKKQ